MTLAEAGEIFDRWCANPPVFLMVQVIARILGWKNSPAAGLPAPNPADVMASAPPGLAQVHPRDTGLPIPTLDPEALRARNQERAIATARRPEDG